MDLEQLSKLIVRGRIMTKTISSDEFSLNAVESFIQTVVFVDDKIYEQQGKVQAKTLDSPKTRKKAGKSSAAKTFEKNICSAEPTETNFSAHDIQVSFAKKRIVCSLHQPGKGHTFGAESNTYKLCASADMIIVDWDLGGDAGEGAKELIETLVCKSLGEDPHQLRLALVYTDSPNLFDIADQIYEKISPKLGDKMTMPEADKGLAFHTLNCRVVVLGKPTNRFAEYKNYEVPEDKLADRAIREFSRLANGLLQAGILKGLAAIRKQSRRIITKFHSGLDAAFLAHRAMSLPHDEAFDHITPLLVAEIESVLEDTLKRPLIPNSTIKDWCNHKEYGKNATKLIQGVAIKDFCCDYCTEGRESALEKHKLKSVPSKKNLPNILCPDDKHDKPLPNMSGFDQLGVLMSQRTFYSEETRFLKLGTILKEMKGEKRFLLCLQPVCDSVRLTKQTPFLFCEMVNKASNNPDPAYIISQDDKTYVDLFCGTKKEHRLLIKFPPNHRNKIIAKKNDHGEYVLTDSESNTYHWLTQLKPAQAQRAAELFSRELSRVGLTESEWVRAIKSK